jgi:peroxiredoxin
MRITRTRGRALGAAALCAAALRATAVSAWFSVGLCAALAAAPARADVALLGDDEIEIAQTSSGDDLWVSRAELARVSGFTLKPQGLCLDALCVPVRPDGDPALVSGREERVRVNVAELARRLGQVYARDDERRVWSFAPVPVTLRPFLESAQAPDFELHDRSGRPVRLLDYRGKKVLLVTWASWCACRDDLPVWEQIYRELKGKGLELISVAEDADGEAAAGPHFDRAGASFTQIIDRKHVITAQFHLVNVPTAIWIDEQGTIVRLDQGAYPRQRRILGVQVGAKGYADALRDWAVRGSESRFALSAEQMTAALPQRTRDELLADQQFRLGAYFREQGDAPRAAIHWDAAKALAPDNWNYHRQEWSDSRFESVFKFLGRAFGRGVIAGKPYYDPIVLPEPEAEPKAAGSR